MKRLTDSCLRTDCPGNTQLIARAAMTAARMAIATRAAGSGGVD